MLLPAIRSAHADAMIKAGKFGEAAETLARANRPLAAAQVACLRQTKISCMLQ